MDHILSGLAAAFGLSVLVFRSRLAVVTIELYRRWPGWRFSERAYEIGYGVAGAAMFLLGMLSVTGIMP